MIGGPARAVVLAAVLVACAAPPKMEPTRYARAEGPAGYGYRDMDLGGDEFSIFAAGNRLTSKERVAEIALLRAARITRERGRTHFVILQRGGGTHEVSHVLMIPVFVGGVLAPIPVGERTTAEPMSLILIRLLPPQSSYPQDALDAGETVRRLAKRVE